MEDLTWQTTEAARRGLVEIERRMSGGELFEAYLAQLQCNGQAQCTTVWAKTTIAYRCRTCQINDSSAICVSCFQAGDHRHHDYVMYHSDSGGCCDCGDPAAWKEEGFCNDHNSYQTDTEPTIPSHLKEVTCKAASCDGYNTDISTDYTSGALSLLLCKIAVQFVLRELSLWVVIILEAKTLAADLSNVSVEGQEMAQTYLIWLQKACSVTALRGILCEEIMCVRPAKDTLVQHTRCFLDTLLSTYARMPEGLMEAETTLFLQMLYNQQFKDSFSRALMKHYAAMILPAAVVPGLLADFKTLDQSLDRVMVQLFNVPETTLNLIQTDHLLECVTSVLGSIVSRCTNKDGGIVNVNHPAIKEKVYSRPQGDLKLILAHEAVSLHVLKERPDVFKTILSTWSMLQWMNPYSQSEAVDFDEQVSWTQAITLEDVIVESIQDDLSVLVCNWYLKARGGRRVPFIAFPASGDTSRSALISAACLTMTSLREFLAKVKFSQGAQDTVSLHIPLHRTLCAIISKLVLMPWEDASDGFLSTLQPALEENEVLALMDHPLRVTVWMAQIRAQLWRQSSEDFSRLELIYRGSIWHAQSMDMDIFMLQFCSVARENMEQSVILTMAQQFDLLDMVTLPTEVSSLNRLLSPKRVSMIHDFLRLVLLIVRERRNTGMSEKESLRSDVIQWLCVRDQTYSQLAYTLSGVLINQSKLNCVLEEVAIYNDPKLQERGFYQLKVECWKEFDPLFAHFYSNDLEEAQERALGVGKLQHYWRLQRPSEAKPPFDRLIRLLHTEACHQLIWNVLHKVTILMKDEVTATSAEALGVMTLQLLGMALSDIRGALNRNEPSMKSQSWQMKASSLLPCNDNLVFIYVKPTINQAAGKVDWDHKDSSGTYPSIYEMLSHLHQVKDSLRLVDLVDHILQLLSSYSESGLESSSSQALPLLDASMDDEQRKLKKQRQDAILANFAARQKAFLENVHDEEDSKAAREVTLPFKEDHGVWSTPQVNLIPSLAILEDKCFSGNTGHDSDQHECAFCRSKCDGKESPTGWIAFVQRYNLPSLIHSRGQILNSVREVSSLLDARYRQDEILFPDMISVVTGSSEEKVSSSGSVDLRPTEHIRCCGHQMHQTCFQRYAESLIRRHYSRSPYEGKGIIDLGKMDFLCPICRRLANVLLPDVNHVVPWKKLRNRQGQNRTGVLPRKRDQNAERLAFFNLEALVPDSSSGLYDEQYWKQYWHIHDNLSEAIALFVSQCLRVRNTFLKEPPDLVALPLCQILWETFAENIVHCEVETREGYFSTNIASTSGSCEGPAPFWSGDPAHWRALTELGKLAMLTNTMPCTAKYQKRLVVLQLIGFDKSMIERFTKDTMMTVANSPQVNRPVATLHSKQEESHVIINGVPVDEVLEPTQKMGVNLKCSERPQCSEATDNGHWEEARKDLTAKRSDVFKVGGADKNTYGCRMLLGHQEEILEVADATNIGWLWNTSRGGALTSSDPFELLIMLLFTAEGWPTIQEIMTMVRVAYVLAAMQASVAFDKLSKEEVDNVNPLSNLKGEVLQVACLPFLRRVALLVHIVTDSNVKCQEFLSMNSACLQQWLNLPNIHDAANLGSKGTHGLNVQHEWKINKLVPLLYKFPRQALLTKLPEVFQELVLQNLKISCVNCHRIPHEPAICLVCGNIFCCGTECCNVGGTGECFRHADKESAGVGMYVLMRSTKLVLLRSNRVCMAPSLYLDLHGEEDAFLKRGHPLHLSHLRLNEIRRLWLTAAFDHDTHILHKSQIGGKVL